MKRGVILKLSKLNLLLCEKQFNKKIYKFIVGNNLELSYNLISFCMIKMQCVSLQTTEGRIEMSSMSSARVQLGAGATASSDDLQRACLLNASAVKVVTEKDDLGKACFYLFSGAQKGKLVDVLTPMSQWQLRQFCFRDLGRMLESLTAIGDGLERIRQEKKNNNGLVDKVFSKVGRWTGLDVDEREHVREMIPHFP